MFLVKKECGKSGCILKKTAFILFASVSLLVAGCQTPLASDQTTKQAKEQPSEEMAPVTKEDQDKLLKEVSYYQAPKKEKEKEKETPVHSEGEKIVQKILEKKQKHKVKKDLNDKNYRQLVLGAATDLSGLTNEQIKEVAKYAKYIDALDSKLKNKRIQQLEAKLKKGKLTADELAELKSLLPIKGGITISIESTKKKPPVKGSKEQKEPTTPKQTTPKDEGFANGEKEPSDKGGQSKGEKDGGTLNGSIGGQLSGGSNDQGGTNGSDDNNQQNGTTGGQNDEQNQGTNGGQQNGTHTNGGQQNGVNGGQNNGNQANGTIGGDDDQQPTNGYDPIKARDYAYKWWNKRNNDKYPYYSRVSGGCYDCWNDCTNFVSQAIFEAGIKEQRTGGTYWYYSDKKPSYAWGVANSFYNHFKTRAEQTRDYWKLEVGDVVNADFDHDGDIEHSAIVTRVDHSGVYVTQHTTDKKDAPLINWFVAGYDVYGWKMKTANR
jgi:hypothetical protein